MSQIGNLPQLGVNNNWQWARLLVALRYCWWQPEIRRENQLRLVVEIPWSTRVFFAPSQVSECHQKQMHGRTWGRERKSHPPKMVWFKKCNFAQNVLNMGVSKNRGGPPKWMVKIMENPIKASFNPFWARWFFLCLESQHKNNPPLPTDVGFGFWTDRWELFLLLYQAKAPLFSLHFSRPYTLEN